MTDWTEKEVQQVLNNGVQLGRQEVVNWIRYHGGSLDGHYKEWHEQLKEWGIESENVNS
jgi:hypothetical protein